MSSNSSISSSLSPDSPGTSANTRKSDLRALSTMMDEGISPKVLLSHLAPSFQIPSNADDMMLWRLLMSMIEPPKRKKLAQYSTIEHAIDLIGKSKKICVLSGAGISTSAGLPDFRSRNGIYVQIHAEHPDLHDPKCMFDIEYFRKNPRPFYQFAKALYPGQYRPTIGHKFIKCLEDHNKLLRNYSQNIDTLEKLAGIKNVVECHGSFAEATCTKCKYTVDGEVIKADIFKQRVPICPKCDEQKCETQEEPGLMKPNIVFFGEQLGELFHNSLEADKDNVDLLIVIGSSLKVRPVALIPRSIPPHVPQILINKEPLDHMNFDIELLGDSDAIIQELCLRLGEGWTHICKSSTVRLNQIVGLPYARGYDKAGTPSEPSPIDREDGQSLSSGLDKMNATDRLTDQDNMSLGSLREENGEELISFKSNRENLVSESMIEELDEVPDKDCEKEIKHIESAMSQSDGGSDDDWEDIEILQSSDPLDIERKIANLNILEQTYCFLKPNRYLFRGAELTNAQLDSFVQESKIDERNKSPQSPKIM